MEIDKTKRKYPGFKFSPTEEELILYYLRRKLDGFQKCVQTIGEIDFNHHEPWDLPAKSVIWSDNEWFFFSTRGKKYSKGSQSRTTESGYWKATGRKRNVKSGSHIIGKKRTLVFHKGRPPKGERTEWMMQEYCMSGSPEDSLVVCRVQKLGEYNSDISIQQLDQAGESHDTPQKDVLDGPIANDVENEDMFQGFTDGCYNPHSIDPSDSESIYDPKLENPNFYNESCSSPKIGRHCNFEADSKASDFEGGNGYDGVKDHCFANILDDDIIKLHVPSLSSNADLLKNDAVNDKSIDFKFEETAEGLPPTLPFHETENRGIRLKQLQQPTEGIPPATLPFSGNSKPKN